MQVFHRSHHFQFTRRERRGAQEKQKSPAVCQVKWAKPSPICRRSPRLRDNAVTNKPKKAMIQEERPKEQYVWVQKTEGEGDRKGTSPLRSYSFRFMPRGTHRHGGTAPQHSHRLPQPRQTSVPDTIQCFTGRAGCQALTYLMPKIHVPQLVDRGRKKINALSS